ncbi:Putative Flp pilus-assembly TadE/G-like [Methylobacterium phyllostachyos]|uniref:Putative Flp pilus-assembly TadE/G-like n=1 Tax=Methylobacterium phyllostachyos TaxID=582672 RepID=A0A1H0A693_9HYPH|nr:TadE/TadG family type IV pilus assembly protein [Methylobacterium phyllostachyos]SDN28493.1 Putative Flp pilus-assembly TadE/G-like [Methylobacterium phyllostachyos]
MPPSLLARFIRDARGTVAIIFALASLPIIGVLGMSLDYTFAGRRQTQLRAIADAAALMTTSPSGMALQSTAAQAAAVTMFNAQAGIVRGTSGTIPSITVSDTTSANGTINRVTTVQFSSNSLNAFANLLKMKSMPISGTSSVSSSTAPNIDFYLLLDTSPSMGIAANQNDINTMVAHTQQQGGCAFACHETNPTQSDVAGNPGGEDNYALARQLGVTLRIDLVQQATSNLIQTAANTEVSNKAVYRVATYTFDQSFNTITNLTANLASAKSDTSKIQMLQVYSNGCLTATNCNNDTDTQFDQAMVNSAYIPNPGKGTNASGDTPQEVLFIVTDGLIDEQYPGYGSQNMTYNGRTITTVGHQYDYCTPLKNRGIRIAVLYTTYNPLPTNGFYNQYVAPFQPTISTAMQNCASPGLFFQVDTGGDINAAMQALFVKAVGTAHLTR